MIRLFLITLAVLAGFLFAAANAGPLETIPVDVRVPVAPRAVPAEGERHLIYELHITNFGSTDLTLNRIEIADGSTGKTIAAYGGDALAALLYWPGPDPAAPRTIGAGLRAIVFVDVRQPLGAIPPLTLAHTLVFEPVTPSDSAAAQTTVYGGAVRVDARPPLVLGPPLRGSGWVASHGLSNASSHRRTVIALNGAARIAQRFAIDWIRIGSDGQAFRGDPANNANWTPYGAEVLAVADGRVANVADGIPQNDPTADAKAVPITFENATGNHVVLDIGGGHFVMYAHLQPRSLRIHVGDRVKRGQVIALLGNSGKSDAPHLHIQVTDGPEPLASEGVPFVFDRFELLGHLPSLKVLVDGTGWRASAHPSLRRHEMPVENAVVGFR